MKRGLLYILFILSIVLFIYHKWFINQQIIGGDWPYYYDNFLKSFSLVPKVWQPWLGNGLGGVQPILGLHFFGSFIVVVFSHWLHVPWNVAYKIGWFGLFLFISGFSSYVLAQTVLRSTNLLFKFLSILIYTTNTYILMVTSGGQMGVALAYSIAPLVVSRFFVLIHPFENSVKNTRYNILNAQQIQNTNLQIRNSLIAGIVLALQLLLDPRIAYITLIGLSLLVIILFRYWQKNIYKNITFLFGLPSIVVILLNFFWIFPISVLAKKTFIPTGEIYTTVNAVKFFSFADFSHALSLLHPNWPENIFGKTYFLQSEFLVIPLVAFSSLLFLEKIKNRLSQLMIIYFALLGLVGVFLAKGANEPFGIIYLWAFNHIPGFIMFRDPTKFYLLIAVSFSILIPFTLQQYVSLIKKGREELNFMLITIIAIVIWSVTIRQAFTGGLRGTFTFHTVPKEYIDLAAFIENQQNDFRTLWVPRQMRFTYESIGNISIEAEPLFEATTATQLKEQLSKPSAQELLKELGIKYVIVPFDSLGELFMTDRKYDERIRSSYESMLDTIPWLKKIQTGNLSVYETPQYEKKFFLKPNGRITYSREDIDRYSVSVEVNEDATLIFSEQYNPGWVFETLTEKIYSQKSSNGLIKFSLNAPGHYDGLIYFEPQRIVSITFIISFVTLLGIICIIMLL